MQLDLPPAGRHSRPKGRHSRRSPVIPAKAGIQWLKATVFLAVLLLAMTACGNRSETPETAAPTHPAGRTSAPTATHVPPAPTAMPTATLMLPTVVPTATTPPTAMPTIAPTATPEPTPTLLSDAPLVHIGDTVFVVDLAVTPAERTQGLSGRPSMRADRGMLFVYKDDGARAFWMPDMHFPLDMVWIRADCTVAGVTADVPNPPLDTPRDQLELYPSAGMVRFILELNAGQASMHGIEPGGVVKFDGQIAGQWGC